MQAIINSVIIVILFIVIADMAKDIKNIKEKSYRQHVAIKYLFQRSVK